MPLDNYITLSQLTKSVKGLVNKINGETTVTNNKIGNLANLNTSAKTDLVAAINEVATSSGTTNSQQILTINFTYERDIEIENIHGDTGIFPAYSTTMSYNDIITSASNATKFNFSFDDNAPYSLEFGFSWLFDNIYNRFYINISTTHVDSGYERDLLVGTVYLIYDSTNGFWYLEDDTEWFLSIDNSDIVQVNADWNATSGVAQILNKPTIPTVTSTYNSSGTDAVNGTAVASAIAGITTTSIGAVSSADLSNYVQKKIGNNINNSQIGQSNSNISLSVYSGQDGNGSINIHPGEITLTTIKDLGTGKGIVLKTNSNTIATFGPTETTITNIVTPTSDTMAANKKYVDDSVSAISVPTKTSDLTNDSGFITTETDPTVPAWAKAANKPTYTASEVGALPDTTVIPAAQVNSDWNATSGVAQILNKPTIPAATTVTQTLTSGTKIGEVNGTSLYAPAQSSISISNTLTSGTLIATINGTNIYAPSYTDADGVSY